MNQSQLPPTPAQAIAQGTLRRRIRQEEMRLAGMVSRQEYPKASYQSGLLNGLIIAGRLTSVLDKSDGDINLSVVTLGGGPIGERQGGQSMAWLRCPECDVTYRMADDPRGLALGPNGATVLGGYVEMCPHCWHESQPGTVLSVELDPR